MVFSCGPRENVFELKKAHECLLKSEQQLSNSGESGLPDIQCWRYLHPQHGGGKQMLDCKNISHQLFGTTW